MRLQGQQHFVLNEWSQMSLQVAEDPGVLCKEGWSCVFHVLSLWLDFLSLSVLYLSSMEKNELSLVQVHFSSFGGQVYISCPSRDSINLIDQTK